MAKAVSGGDSMFPALNVPSAVCSAANRWAVRSNSGGNRGSCRNTESGLT
jgi:hypothetical protein